MCDSEPGALEASMGLPSSPLRTYPSQGNIFTFAGYPAADQTHLLQRLQPLPYPYGGYAAHNPYSYSYPGIAYNSPANTCYTQPFSPSPLSARRGFAGAYPPAPAQDNESASSLIKPLSQVGTLTTTDHEGRLRVIVPVPSGSHDPGDLLKALRIQDDLRPAPITRSTSEKVPNRSELMSQVQRTAWARHTTK